MGSHSYDWNIICFTLVALLAGYIIIAVQPMTPHPLPGISTKIGNGVFLEKVTSIDACLENGDKEDPQRLNECLVKKARMRAEVRNEMQKGFADLDADGKPELVDEWGNPVAVILGELGGGERYVLANGETVVLLSFERVTSRDRARHLTGVDWRGRVSLGDTILLMCNWLTPRGKRLTIYSYYDHVAHAHISGEEVLLFPISTETPAKPYNVWVEAADSRRKQ